MLSICARDMLQVRHEQFEWGARLRLLYASDLHLTRWTPHIVEQLDQVCREHQPDILLLGGDLVDLRNGLPLLLEFVRSQSCSVWAVSGNHDEMVGVSQVRATIEVAGGRWLEGMVRLHPRLSLSGTCQPVTENIENQVILCQHDPAIFPRAVRCGYRLVLAGHYHGGQWVLARHKGRMYPAAFFYPWNGDRFTSGQSTLLVSKGMNDTLPIRWNCPREVILCYC